MSGINISPTLIDFLEIFRGAEISLDKTQKINEGKLDLLIGLVAAQNYTKYKGDIADSKTEADSDNNKRLTQVTIKSETGKVFTFSDNIKFKLAQAAIDLNNSDLINRPSIIYIQNIREFEDNFQDAARYGQRVACVYDRICNQLILVSIESNHNLSTRNSGVQQCHRWADCEY